MLKASEAVILAGGLGTRLRTVIADRPKPMAPVKDRPFLHYLLEYCAIQGLSRIILAVGYKGDMVRDYFGDRFLSASGHSLELDYSFEDTPLGTGGAIRLAVEKIHSETLFVLNGDTYFDVKLDELSRFHTRNKARISIALKDLTGCDRYGTVEMSGNRITAFREKRALAQGRINGGTYCLDQSILKDYRPGDVFSFEKDILEKYAESQALFGLPFTGDFLDIGVPEDYRRAESLLERTT